MSDALASDADAAWTVRRRIRIRRLHNDAERLAVQRCLTGIDGVLRVSVDAPKSRVVVDYLQTRTDYRSLQEELEAAGFAPAPGRWARIKSEAGIAPDQASCHTALAGNDVIKGHVPASEIRRLLAEQPDARGLTVPGMPPGSPGMETPNPKHYQVLLIGKDGRTSVFAEHEPHAPPLISERISITVQAEGPGGPDQ